MATARPPRDRHAATARPQELATLRRVVDSFRKGGFDPATFERSGQPRRRKHHLPLAVLQAPPNASASSGGDGDGILRSVHELRGLQSVFFTAYHLLRSAPDYAAHGRLDPATDYFEKVRRPQR